jgi:hypothetical protein
MDEFELAVDKGRLNESIPLVGMKVCLEVAQQPTKLSIRRRNVRGVLDGCIRGSYPVLLSAELATPLITATYAVHEDEMDAEEQVQR